MRADLAQFYQLDIDDVWRGTLPARHVVILTAHLQLNPQSRVFAIRGGNPELQGWSTEAVLLARLNNTLLAVVGVKDNAAFIQYPGRETDEEVLPYKTIAEFSEAGFSRFMTGG